jgi:flagellar motility protein MotE (MotC chaperone)
MKYYSKRELYALGETLGDCVTEHKVGGRIYGGGGKGGGGSPAPAPSSQNVTQTSIPEYARPYVEEMLGKTQALTDINQNPYQNYGGQRIAEFSPTQQQAFQDVQNMQAAPQLGQASGLAGISGLGSIGTGGQMGQVGQQYANQATNPYAQQAYMSPYIQNALQPQLQEMQRQYGITGQQERARAVGQGAFGGNRQALMQAENERNKNMAMNAAIGSGYQNAFQAAQQAQQFGAGLGLQGLQGQMAGFGQANQAAGTLGQLGQTQYAQNMGINQARQNVGAIQQAQAQQGLDTAYQDFLKQKNYPYQQLAFMSDMTRGLPLSQSSQSIYSAPPSAVSQLGGLGMSALGIYGMSGGFQGKKEGGLMSAKAYKEGGLTYQGGGEVSSMTTQQLTEMLNNPSIDQFLAAEIEKELMVRRRMAMNPETDQIMAPALGRSGIASIGTGDMVPDEMAAGAGGGIVAFADRGVVNLKKQSPADALDERIRNMEEREAASYKNLYENNNVFEKSKAAEESIKKEITDIKDKAFWEALTYAGLGTMEGSQDPATRSNPLSNLGYGAQKGLAAYGKSAEKQNQLNKLLLTQGVEQEKAKYGRDVSNLNALQTSLGQAYNRKLLSSQIGAGAEDKALLKVQTLINSDDQLPLLYKQRDMYEPSDPKYKAYNDAINSIKRSYFEQAGIKRPYVAPANVQFPEEKKEPGFFSRLLGGSSPAATKTPGVMRFDAKGNPV